MVTGRYEVRLPPDTRDDLLPLHNVCRALVGLRKVRAHPVVLSGWEAEQKRIPELAKRPSKWLLHLVRTVAAIGLWVTLPVLAQAAPPSRTDTDRLLTDGRFAASTVEAE